MKREKYIKFFLLIVSIWGFVYFSLGLDFGQSGRLENMMIDHLDYAEIKDERIKSETVPYFEIQMNEIPIPFDHFSDVYLYSVVLNDEEKFNPHMKVLSSELSGYAVAIKEKKLSETSIENNDPIDLLIYTDEEYYEYSIYMTNMPTVTLQMADPVEDKENPIGDLDRLAHFTLSDNRDGIPSSERIQKSDTYIRLRGATSRHFPKNQFRLNLREFSIGGDVSNRHLALLDMRSDDDWILNSPYNDPEKMRNLFSINLWYQTAAKDNRFEIMNGTEGKLVEVFINNRYWGIYTLMHPIDAKQVELDSDSSPEQSELYYRTFSHEDINSDTFLSSGDSLRNGRVELRERNQPYGTAEQWSPVYEHLEMLEATEEELREYLYTHTDMENQIHYYLFYLLSQATDNDKKNRNYISKFDDDKRIMLESPWDLDLTWGLRWTPDHHTLATVRGQPDTNHISSASLIRYAIDLGMKDIIEAVEEQYWNLRGNIWSEESLLEMISQYENQIFHSGAIERDRERWPTTAYNESADEFKEYIQQRLVFADQFIKQDLRR